MVDELDFTKPQRVRPAPGCPNILVAHLSVAPKPYVYVGRQMPGVVASPLGNPYRGDGAIESFRQWLRAAYGAYKKQGERVRQDQWAAGREVDRLAELYREQGFLHLACWCAEVLRDKDGSVTFSAPCHADVIADAVVGVLALVEPVAVEVEGAGVCGLWRVPGAPKETAWHLTQGGVLLRRAGSLAEARAPMEPGAPIGWVPPVVRHAGRLAALGYGKCDSCGLIQPGIEHKGICADCRAWQRRQAA